MSLLEAWLCIYHQLSVLTFISQLTSVSCSLTVWNITTRTLCCVSTSTSRKNKKRDWFYVPKRSSIWSVIHLLNFMVYMTLRNLNIQFVSIQGPDMSLTFHGVLYFGSPRFIQRLLFQQFTQSMLHYTNN